MNTREKLIKLLSNAHSISMEAACFEDATYAKQLRMEADHLIANGVTIATDNNVGHKWIPVTERLPEKMGQCVCRYVFGENAEYPFFQVLWYFANTEKPHFQHEGSMGLRVTHWMHLPSTEGLQ